MRKTDLPALLLFQFTPLREGRTADVQGCLRHCVFQFTPLREGRTGEPRGGRESCGHFNSRPSARGEQEAITQFSTFRRISIHAPPRGANGICLDIACRTRRISIHAPPRGANNALGGGQRARNISIHAPPRGANLGVMLISRPRRLFQFTPLREGRTVDSLMRTSVGSISIHAPPRGANALLESEYRLCRISIHAPPRGANRACRFLVFCGFPFQFTPLREGRTHHSPTAHGRAAISIHAPPRGANARKARRHATARFQFTPLREGRTRATRRKEGTHMISIHAPPRGANNSA